MEHDGIDGPKLISRATTFQEIGETGARLADLVADIGADDAEHTDDYTRFQDVTTDLIHVVAAKYGVSVKVAAAMIHDWTAKLLYRARYHAEAEAAQDDLCPAGVTVVD